MNRPPVLVTGGAGYIGSHAVLALKDCGWSVAVLDDLSTGSRGLVPDDVTFYQGNIADRRLVGQIIDEQKIGAIMHFAGSIVVSESVADPLRYYGNNTVATHALLSSAIEGGVRHIVFSSTAAVYGAAEKVPVSEDDIKSPINPYGSSKLMTEQMLRDCSAAYGFNYGALRYFNVAGADPQGRTGQVGIGSTHLIKVAVEAALGKRDHVDVFGTDYPTIDGTCIRDYIHVSDLVDAHVLALERLIQIPDESFILNCGYGRGLSVLQVLDAVDRKLNKPIPRRAKSRRLGDPAQLIACNSRLLEKLPWKPQYTDIDTIVTHALEWERRLTWREERRNGH